MPGGRLRPRRAPRSGHPAPADARQRPCRARPRAGHRRAGIGLVRRHRPAVVVVLGGHASFACGVGAVLARRPLVLLEQNVRAGAVNRVLRPVRHRQRGVLRGHRPAEGHRHRQPAPTRDRRRPPRPKDRAAACAELGLPADRIVIVRLQRFARVAPDQRGGAGAGRAVGRPRATRRPPRGRPKRDWPNYSGLAAGVPGPGRLLYRPVEYEDRMHLLLQAADVAVTRAGGSVAELAALGVPAVLVPLPIATRDHQTANGMAVAGLGRCGRRRRRRPRRRPAGRRARGDRRRPGPPGRHGRSHAQRGPS